MPFDLKQRYAREDVQQVQTLQPCALMVADALLNYLIRMLASGKSQSVILKIKYRTITGLENILKYSKEENRSNFCFIIKNKLESSETTKARII